MANKDPKEEDKVAAAYENISKKLDSLRNGGGGDEDDKKEPDVEDQDDAELAEWKGPKPMKNEEVEEDDDEEEIRRVKLKNLASEDDDSDEPKGSKESEDEDEEEDSGEAARVRSDDEVAADEPKSKKKWEPGDDDPLDEEDQGIKGQSDEADENDVDELDDVKTPEDVEEKPAKEPIDEEELPVLPRRPVEDSFEGRKESGETKYYENQSEMDFSKKRDPQPDTLDDLAQDAPRRGGDLDEEEYAIPNLKGSRQEGSNIGYNAHSETESFARGYQDKNMDNAQNNSGNSDPNNFFSQHGQAQAPKRANKFHLLVLVIIGVAVIGFTVYILKGGFGEISMTSEPSPSPSAIESPSPTPTPTPEPEIDRSQFSVRVLNGTSTSGLAKTVNDKLDELGYDAANPANATNSAFTQTEIRVKSGGEGASLLQRLILDLAPDYEAVESTNLDDDSDYDAEVILGEK